MAALLWGLALEGEDVLSEVFPEASNLVIRSPGVVSLETRNKVVALAEESAHNFGFWLLGGDGSCHEPARLHEALNLIGKDSFSSIPDDARFSAQMGLKRPYIGGCGAKYARFVQDWGYGRTEARGFAQCRERGFPWR